MKYKKSHLILFLIIVFIWFDISAQDLSMKKVEEYIKSSMEKYSVPGAAVGIIKDGKTVYMKGFGFKNINTKEPVDEYTVFGIGSATKAFTGTLSAILVHEGKIKWHDKVIDHLPQFKLPDQYITRNMIIKDLLSHRSGYGDDPFLFLGSSFSRDQILERLIYLEPLPEPMFGFRIGLSYNNLMFLTAGKAMAASTGKTWDENIRQKIFEPLGMDNSGTCLNDLDKVKNLASPHCLIDNKLVPIKWGNLDNIGPAGSISSNVADLTKFVKLIMGDGKYDGNEFWSKNIQNEMTSPQNIVNFPLGWSSPFRTYGIGWLIYGYRGKKVVWHAGNCDGMSAVIGMIPEKNLGVVVLINSFLPAFEGRIMLRIFEKYLGIPENEWEDMDQVPPPFIFAMKKEMSFPDKKEKMTLSAEKYTGNYSHEYLGNARIKYENGKHILDFEFFPDAVLIHKTKDTFFADFEYNLPQMFSMVLENTVVDVTFKINEKKQIPEIEIEKFGVFKKVK